VDAVARSLRVINATGGSIQRTRRGAERLVPNMITPPTTKFFFACPTSCRIGGYTSRWRVLFVQLSSPQIFGPKAPCSSPTYPSPPITSCRLRFTTSRTSGWSGRGRPLPILSYPSRPTFFKRFTKRCRWNVGAIARSNTKAKNGMGRQSQ